ncbi:hypothetical protein RYX36_034560 [Vicia faba]
MDQNNLITGGNSVVEIDEVNHSDDSSNIQDKELSSENDTVRSQHLFYDDCDEKYQYKWRDRSSVYG